MPIYPRRDRDGWIVSLPNPGGSPSRIRKNAKSKLEAKQLEADLVQKMRKGPLKLRIVCVKFQAIFFDLFNTLLHFDFSRLPEVDFEGQPLRTTTVRVYEQIQEQCSVSFSYQLFLEKRSR